MNARPTFSYAIGIDLGTTTSRIHCIPDSDPWVFPEEIPAVRSIVAALPPTPPRTKHDWYTGLEAYGIDGCFARFKLQMGSMAELQTGAEFSRPEVLAARLIWVLKRRLQTQLSRQHSDAHRLLDVLDKTRSVTITVPAGWSAVERSATIFAAKMAGFVNVNIIEEPVAAYVAVARYYPSRLGNARNVLVFDCGGGTLDLALISRDPANEKALPIVRGRAMDTNCRTGEDIDEIIAQKWAGDLWTELDRMDRFGLREAARQVKQYLNPENQDSSRPFTVSAPKPVKTTYKEFGVDELILSHEELDEIVEPLTKCAGDRTKELLELCGLTDGQVNCIVMVGGSSYLRAVKDKIRALFPSDDPKVILVQPDKLVAVGAATYQSSLDRNLDVIEPTLTLDTFLEYQSVVGGSETTESSFLGYAGQSLKRDIKGPIGKSLSIPRGISFPTTWRVFQRQTIPSSDSREVASVTIVTRPSAFRSRLFLEYRINRNGELSLWRPRLLGMPGANGLELSHRSPYDWANQTPSNGAIQHGIAEPEPVYDVEGV